MHDADCKQIDDFIAAYKTLDGLMPPWKDFYARDFQVRWAILDARDIQFGELNVVSNAEGTEIAFVALYRQQMFYRLDIVPPGEVHPNPFSAHTLNLPRFVTGPHVHGWEENREYVRKNGFQSLPFRRQIPGLVGQLSDGLHWVAKDLNIDVRGEQRVMNLPDRKLI